MTLYDQLEKYELKELLVKCWMSHDGAWFLSAYMHYGVRAANKLNKASIKTLSTLEMQRVLKARGTEKKSIKSFNDLKILIDDVFSVLKGDFMDFNYTFIENNKIQWKMGQCFAYEGMKRLGIQEKYKCGVLYRVHCWLNALNVKHKFQPPINTCLLCSQKKCVGEIIIEL